MSDARTDAERFPFGAPGHPVEAAAAAFVEALQAYEAEIAKANPPFSEFGTITILGILEANGLGKRNPN